LAQRRFHDKHRRLYGFQRDDTPVELVRLQVSVIGRTPASAELGGGLAAPEATTAPVPQASRQLYARGRRTGASIYDRSELKWGNVIVGPSVVEEAGSTTYVPEGWKLTVLEDGTLQLVAAPGEQSNGTGR
jgi:N-methylhydantoinase A